MDGSEKWGVQGTENCPEQRAGVGIPSRERAVVPRHRCERRWDRGCAVSSAGWRGACHRLRQQVVRGEQTAILHCSERAAGNGMSSEAFQMLSLWTKDYGKDGQQCGELAALEQGPHWPTSAVDRSDQHVRHYLSTPAWPEARLFMVHRVLHRRFYELEDGGTNWWLRRDGLRTSCSGCIEELSGLIWARPAPLPWWEKDSTGRGRRGEDAGSRHTSTSLGFPWNGWLWTYCLMVGCYTEAGV